MNDDDHRLRTMTEADIEDVAELERRTFPSPWTRDAFRYEVRQNPYARNYVVRTAAEELVAYANVHLIEEELLINNIAVAQPYRSRGLGHRLMSRILEDGRAGGCRRALLEVRPTNEVALALYGQFGFRRLGVRRRYYSDGEDALVLGRRL